jgi:spore coat protein CotH
MRYSILILIHFFYSLNLGAQSFYDPLQIQEIQINFPFSNWDQKLDSLHLADSDARLLASYVIINGQRFDSIGVRYKGNSTYNANRNKNPFNIKLDFIKSKQDYQGYTTLKLSNAFMDPSFFERSIRILHCAPIFTGC